MTPILSIVIPTRDRAQYALSCIAAALVIEDPGLQVVVHDNGSDDALGNEIRARFGEQRRLVYIRESAPISMVDNFERALANATGEYVTVIGDDDGVHPDVVNVARWALRNDVNAVVCPLLAAYIWPDFQQRYYGSRNAAVLTIKPFTPRLAFNETRAGIDECVASAGLNLVHATNLPKLYYGLVRRRCLLQAKAASGAFFPSISPDMAAAISAALYVDRVAVIEFPVFLPGSSFKSASGLSARKQHVGELLDQPSLPRDIEDRWICLVPRFYSVQTMWAQAVLETLRAHGELSHISRFNIPLLHAECASFNPRYAIRTFANLGRAASAQGTSLVWAYAAFFGHVVRIAFARARLLGRRILSRLYMSVSAADASRRIHGIQDIEQAVQTMSAELARQGLSLARLLNDPRQP